MMTRISTTVPIPTNRMVRTSALHFNFELIGTSASRKGPRSLVPSIKTVSVHAPKTFRPRRLLIPSTLGDLVVVLEIKFGDVDVLMAGGSSVPANVFAEQAVAPIDFPRLQKDTNISITAANVGDDVLFFRAMLLGEFHDE